MEGDTNLGGRLAACRRDGGLHDVLGLVGVDAEQVPADAARRSASVVPDLSACLSRSELSHLALVVGPVTACRREAGTLRMSSRRPASMSTSGLSHSNPAGVIPATWTVLVFISVMIARSMCWPRASVAG